MGGNGEGLGLCSALLSCQRLLGQQVPNSISGCCSRTHPFHTGLWRGPCSRKPKFYSGFDTARLWVHRLGVVGDKGCSEKICGQQQSPCIAISLPVCEMGKEQPVPPSSQLSPSESPAPLSEDRILPIHNRRKEIQAFPEGGRDQRQACASLKLDG